MVQSKMVIAAALALPLIAALAAAPATAQTAAKETRIEKADILKHPIADVAVKYAEAVHAGKVDEMLKLTSAKGQKDYKAETKSEQKEILRFWQKHIPAPAALKAAIESSGILLVAGPKATLNLTASESKSVKPGEVSASASTTAMPFLQEGGTWKFAQ